MHFIAASVALLAAVASALPTIGSSNNNNNNNNIETRANACTTSATNQVIFTFTLGGFTKARNARKPACFDWTSDNCSKIFDKPLKFDFKASCQRHDFGYRNSKKQKRFTRAMKAAVDTNFKKDMYSICKKQKGIKGSICRRVADAYYGVVVRLGKRDETENVYDETIEPSESGLEAREAFDVPDFDEVPAEGEVIPEINFDDEGVDAPIIEDK